MKSDNVYFLKGGKVGKVDMFIVLYQACGMTYEEAEYTAFSELGINCY